MTLYNDDGTVDETAIECSAANGSCGNHNELGTVFCDLCGERQENSANHQVYVDKKFTPAHMEIIMHANSILDNYERQGFMLTLRQLYYQFVSGVPGFPNTVQSYKRLGGIITDARLAGLMSFERIEDRGRVVDEPYVQADPMDVLSNIHLHYTEDLWAGQQTYCEVWVEKDALSSVIERPCNKLQVPFMACKGYMSSSAAWAAGNRFREASERGKDCVLIHLGDHDPSGIDMTRDNHKRLELFSDGLIDIRRIALNMDQLLKYDPPPNPAKETDSRAPNYIRDHGDQSWELDALTPSVIGELITTEVNSLIEVTAWNDAVAQQRFNRAEIMKVSNDPDAVFAAVGAEFKDDL